MIDSPGPRTAPGLEDVEQKPRDREKFPGGLGCYISPSDHSSSPGMPCTPTWSTQNAERGQEFFRPEAECSRVVSRRMVWDTKPPWSHTFLLQLQMSFFYSKCIPLKKEQTNQNKRVIVTTATEIYTLNTFPCDEIFFYNI